MAGLTPTITSVGVQVNIFGADEHVFNYPTVSVSETGLTAGDTVSSGSFMAITKSTGVAKVQKTAVLYADATNTATDYHVLKGHNFIVGDYLAQVIGGKAYAITAIDVSNAAYDVLTVGTTLAVALTAVNGVVLFLSSATGASAAAYVSGDVYGVLFADYLIGSGKSASVTYSGFVFERTNIKYTAALKALVPKITFW